MFCPKCGHEMISGGRFCTHCGADVQSMIQMPKDSSPQTDNAPPASQTQEPPMNHTQMQDRGGIGQEKEAPPVQTEAEARSGNTAPAVADKNQAYYRTEFESIGAGKKPRFNWAAFLLGPGMCFYRKCEDLFKKYFLPALVFNFTGLVVEMVGSVRFDLKLMVIGGAAAAIGGVWMLVSSIRFGSRFNRLYYERCKGSPPSKSAVSMRNMILYYVAAAGLCLLISLAGTVMLRQQYADIFDPDTSMDEPSETIAPGVRESEPSDIEGPDGMLPPIQEDDGLFKDFTGGWADGNGNYLLIDYIDDLKQDAYVWVHTDAGEFTAKLKPDETGGAYGFVFVNGASAPSYTIHINSYGEYLEAGIGCYIGSEYYDTFKFVPLDPAEFIGGYPYIDMTQYNSDEPGVVEDVPRDSNGIPYSEYDLHFCEGSYTDYNDSIIVSLTLLPNETEFSCELFWIHGKFLEEGTVSPGVPAQLSGGTTITLDLYQGMSAHVLLEGDGLVDGPYEMELTKIT